MKLILEWLGSHYIEILGTITGLVYVYLSVRQHIWLWPLGILTSSFQLSVFYNSKIYADMSLQAYYILVSCYGWYYWRYGKNKNDKALPVIKMKLIQWLWFLLSSTSVFVIIRFVLIRFTNSDVPNIDAFTTALSITGTYLLARKYIDNWLIWIVVDIFSSGLYFYKGHYFFVFLYAFLAFISIVGYRKWKNDIVLA